MASNPIHVLICEDAVHAAAFEAVRECVQRSGAVVHTLPFRPDAAGKMDLASEFARPYLQATELLVTTVRYVCSAQALDHAPKLRGIVVPSVGVDSIDVEAATERSILIGHGATVQNSIGMAEATVMLILNLLYQLPASQRILQFSAKRPTAPHSRQMSGKTIGIVGYGKIAQRLQALCVAFGAHVLIHSPSGRVYDLPDGARACELDVLLTSSDVVTLHANAIPTNPPLIQERELALMKPTAYLVNTARGSLIDQTALCKALSTQRIAGAALDTFEVEPLPPDDPIRSLPNVILTPHIVGHTVESLDSLREALIENVACLLNYTAPRFCKNPEASSAAPAGG